MAVQLAGDLYRTLFQRAGDAIIIFDPASDQLVDANPAACALFGCSRQELQSAPLSAVRPDDVSKLRGFLHMVSERGERIGEAGHYLWSCCRL